MTIRAAQHTETWRYHPRPPAWVRARQSSRLATGVLLSPVGLNLPLTGTEKLIFLDKIRALGVAKGVINIRQSPILQRQLAIANQRALSPQHYFQLLWALQQFNQTGSKTVQATAAVLLIKSGIYSLSEVQGKLLGPAEERKQSFIFIIERLCYAGLSRQYLSFALRYLRHKKVRARVIGLLCDYSDGQYLKKVKPYISSDDESTRDAAWRYLLKHGQTTEISLAIQQTSSEFHVPMLAKYGNEAYSDLVLPYLKSSNPDVLVAAIRFFANHGSRANMPQILPFLRYPLEEAQQAAWQFLFCHGNRSDLKRIESFLTCGNLFNREMAWRFLARYSTRKWFSLVASRLKKSKTAWDALINMAKVNLSKGTALKLAEQHLSHHRSDLVAKAIEVLSTFGSKDLCPLIIPLLASRTEEVRCAALRFFLLHGDSSNLPEIEPIAIRGAGQSRALALLFLKKYGSKEQKQKAWATLDYADEVSTPYLWACCFDGSDISTAPSWLKATRIIQELQLDTKQRQEFFDGNSPDSLSCCEKAEPFFVQALRLNQHKVVNASFILKLFGAGEPTALCLDTEGPIPFGTICQAEVDQQEIIERAPSQHVHVDRPGWEPLRASELRLDTLLAMHFDLEIQRLAQIPLKT